MRIWVTVQTQASSTITWHACVFFVLNTRDQISTQFTVVKECNHLKLLSVIQSVHYLSRETLNGAVQMCAHFLM